jgi:hypothetical protein
MVTVRVVGGGTTGGLRRRRGAGAGCTKGGCGRWQWAQLCRLKLQCSCPHSGHCHMTAAVCEVKRGCVMRLTLPLESRRPAKLGWMKSPRVREDGEEEGEDADRQEETWRSGDERAWLGLGLGLGLDRRGARGEVLDVGLISCWNAAFIVASIWSYMSCCCECPLLGLMLPSWKDARDVRLPTGAACPFPFPFPLLRVVHSICEPPEIEMITRNGAEHLP